MKVAVYTLTRDRKDYTEHCFAKLKQNCGYPYTHYIVDNGSVDGTQDWLKKQNDLVLIELFKENQGISVGSNIAVDRIIKDGFDLIIKMDNDCEVVSSNIIGQIIEIYTSIPKFAPRYILSPKVEGIVNQPTRVSYTQLSGRRIGITGIVGGLFHIVPAMVYKAYRFPLNLPKAFGQDQHFCEWANRAGCTIGYIEGLTVNHYETTVGQAQRYPEYFKRKREEEK